MKDLTDNDFNRYLEQHEWVLVDYWAAWCGPCKAMNPVLEKLNTERPQIYIAKVNIDKEAYLTARADVESIPNIILYHNGKPVERFIGARGLQAFKLQLDAAMEKHGR